MKQVVAVLLISTCFLVASGQVLSRRDKGLLYATGCICGAVGGGAAGNFFKLLLVSLCHETAMNFRPKMGTNFGVH
jgi:hypothetical protein